MTNVRKIESAAHFSLNFEKDRGEVHANQVPASVLTQTLTGLQRIIHLVAMHQEQREIKARARITQDIEQRFPVMCRLPTQGSYELPVSIGIPGSDLLGTDAPDTVAKKSLKVLSALSEGDRPRLNQLIPDATYRENIRKAAKNAAPKPQTGYRLRIRDSAKSCIFDAHNALKHAHAMEELRLVTESVETTGVVTGKLIRADFEARKLEILHPVSNKILDCHYQDDVEPLLLNNPRELIQVVGTVELDADDALVRITEVQDIIEVDLSPITLHEVHHEQLHLAALKPITLTPTLSETKQLYEAEDETLGVSLFAFTRDELTDLLHDELAVLWVEYARAEDEELTGEARLLKQRLHETFREQA